MALLPNSTEPRNGCARNAAPDPAGKPRRLLCMLLTLWAVWPATLRAQLLVYFPTPRHPHEIEQALFTRLPKQSVTVFSRYKDFESRFQSSPPAAALVSGPLSKELTNYRVALEGTVGGKPAEPYVLLSPSDSLDPSNTDTMTLAVVDALGRRKQSAFVRELLGRSPPLLRVTKTEDLLYSLNLGMARALLVPATHGDYLARVSNQELNTSPIPDSERPILRLMVREDEDTAALVRGLKQMSEDALRVLGLEGWQ